MQNGQGCFGLPSRRVPPSEITVDSSSSNGTTNTLIPIFNNLRKNVGTAITYVTSAALGDSFQINEPGIYAITSSLEPGVLGKYVAFTVNCTSLSTAPESLTYSQGLRVLGGAAAAGVQITPCWTGSLNANDVVRLHVDASTALNNSQTTMVTICKVSS